MTRLPPPGDSPGTDRPSARHGSPWQRLRIAVLLGVLVVVLLWAAKDALRRRARTRWERPLSVALVVLRDGAVEDDAIAMLRQRSVALASRLGVEAARYRSLGFSPFSFEMLGPVDVAEALPRPLGEDPIALGRYAFDLWRYRRRIDGPAGLRAGGYDAVIYVLVRPPRSSRRQWVEGVSQNGGRFGSVEVELNAGMTDFALFVVAHELLHTIGATDKYDEAGRTLVPGGLADPDLLPIFPQPRAEVMARSRVVRPGVEEPPDTLDELGVGPITAQEIGWRR